MGSLHARNGVSCGRIVRRSFSRSRRYFAICAILAGLLPKGASAQSLNTFAALFDTRLTSVRSDDSLIVRIPTEAVLFNTIHYLNGGAPVADLPFEAGAVYRLVFQINSTSDWDFEPKDSGKGLFALAGTTGRFGRAAAPIPGTRELLLTNTFVADEYIDHIDFVIGLTKKFNPRVPWSMISNPYTDPDLEDKTGEIGSLLSVVPTGTFIDCIDDDKNWEDLTGNCEKERYYFYELWFKADLDWKNGDTVDVFLHIEGKPEPTNIEQLHARFRLVDDDTIPPAISDFSPEVVPAGLSFNISCKISDPSGVHDDATGSFGQGVYLLWDNDGSLIDDANEILMSSIGEGYYGTDIQIGPRNEGDLIVYAVHACDNDTDGGRIDDRSCGASDVQTVQILGSVYLFDEHESLHPVAAYAGEQGVSIHLDLNNPMSHDFVLYRTSTVSFTDGVHVVTANLRNETIVPAGASHFPVSFDAVAGAFRLRRSRHRRSDARSRRMVFLHAVQSIVDRFSKQSACSDEAPRSLYGSSGGFGRRSSRGRGGRASAGRCEERLARNDFGRQPRGVQRNDGRRRRAAERRGLRIAPALRALHRVRVER